MPALRAIIFDLGYTLVEWPTIENDYPWPRPEQIVPTASIKKIAELPLLLDSLMK